LDFSVYNISIRIFQKDNGSRRIQSKILPQIIKTETTKSMLMQNGSFGGNTWNIQKVSSRGCFLELSMRLNMVDLAGILLA